MSNINKHGVNMNNNVLFQEISGENAATIQGGASAQVFTDINFSGTASFVFDNEIAFFADTFNDKISSIKVLSGEWTFYADPNFQGQNLVLAPGEYSDIRNFEGGRLNDVFSSAFPTVR